MATRLFVRPTEGDEPPRQFWRVTQPIGWHEQGNADLRLEFGSKFAKSLAAMFFPLAAVFSPCSSHVLPMFQALFRFPSRFPFRSVPGFQVSFQVFFQVGENFTVLFPGDSRFVPTFICYTVPHRKRKEVQQ
jgi:hypothetical protein